MDQKKNIAFLLLGRTVSKFGSAFYLIALPLYVLQVTENLAESGVFFALSSFAALFVTPLFGSFIEKHNRKWLLISCDLLTAIISFILLLSYEKTTWYLIVVFVGTSATNLISNIFEVSSKMIFSEIVDDSEIEKYNAMKSIFDNASTIIAPALGTVVYGLCGFRMVLFVVAIAYALSAFQECFIFYQKAEHVAETKSESWAHNFAEGLHYLKADKGILLMFVLMMSLNFFVANADEIINPGIIVQKYQISETLYGLTSSLAIIGTLVAGVLVFKNKFASFRKNLNRLFVINSVIMICIGIGSVCLTDVPNLYFVLFLGAQFLLGVITTYINVPLISYFQINVPIHYQGRIFSLMTAVSGALIPLGIMYTGLLASDIGADMAYIINNVCVIVLVIWCAASEKRKFEKC